jgi:phosphatidylinositol glycan class F
MSAPRMDAINVLNTDLARLYTHIHPFLLLSGYLFNFASIVSDPVSLLSKLAIPLSALQIAYVIICLPTAGSVNPKGSGPKKPSKSRTESINLSSKITVSV